MRKISSSPNNLVRLLGAIPYILCIVLILIPSPHIAAQVNLVLNGTFEGGIEGWSGGIHETTTLHSGTGSLKVADTSSDRDIKATTTEIISIEPQLTYYIEMWIKGEREDQPVQVVISQYEGQQWISGANKLLDVSATTGWTLFRTELSDWRHNASGVTLTLRPTPYQGSDPHVAQGTAFFDDIVLIPYAANLVENGSFESGTTGWTGAGSITKSNPHVGSQAVIISDKTTDASIRQTSDLIPIFAEREYFFESYVRAEKNPHKVSIVISQFNANRKWISDNNLAFFPEVGTDWTRFTKILDSFNPATHYITIGLNPTFWEASSTGAAVFDDVQFRHYEGNLILNSSFESGSGAWTSPDPSVYELSHDFANSGKFSLHITDRSTSKDFNVSIDDLIPVFENKDYLLQAWMRAAYDGQRSAITVSQYDQDQVWISGENIYHSVSISPSGTLFQRIIQDLDPRTAYVRINVNPVPWTSGGTNTGEVWFDDVRFYPYNGNQIANGDFERGLHNWAGGDLTPLKTSNSYEGAISLGITDASTTAHASATTKEFIPIAQGESYSFSAWIYTGDPSQPPQMILQQYAGETVDDWISGKNLSFSTQVDHGNRWTCVQNFVSEFDPQTETVRANLSAVPWTANRDLTGTAIFDQVIFRHEPVAGTWLSNAGSTQLWWAPPDQKVLRRMEPVAGSSIDSSIHIAGGGGESEAFQLVLTPAGATQLRDASVSLSNGVTTLPATISQVGYLPISEPTEAGSFPGCEFPDPLLPLNPAHPTTLDANENQPVWVAVDIPRGTPPGTYRGDLRVVLGSQTVTVPVELQVYDFELPVERHLETAYGFSMSQILNYHNLMGNSDLQRDQLRRYLDAFARARISPTNPVGNDWYHLIYRNLNWLDANLAVDPSDTTNNALLVHDDSTDGYVSTRSSVPISVDSTQSYQLEWDVFIPNTSDLERDPATSEYSVIVSQYNKGKWISGANLLLPQRADAAFVGWVHQSDNINGLRAETTEVQISFNPIQWEEDHSMDPPISRANHVGAAYFDNVQMTLLSTGEAIEIQNSTFDPVAPEDLEIRLETQAFHEAADYAFGLGLDSIALYMPHFSHCSLALESQPNTGCTKPTILGYPWLSDEYNIIYPKVVDAIATYMLSQGWLDEAYVYWADEPRNEWFDEVKDGMELLEWTHKGDPSQRLRRLLTINHPFNDPDLNSLVDIWVPQTDEYNLYQDWLSDRREDGDETWWYVSTGVRTPYSNNFIDYAGVDLRARLWSAWEFESQGSLYWETAYWTNDGSCFKTDRSSCRDPLTDPQSYFLRDDGTLTTFGNGDGRLFYPPQDWASATGPLVTEPIISQRLELIREGMEDYELFWMLNDARTRLAQRPVVTQKEQVLLEHAYDLLDLPDSLIRSLTDYSKDPQQYYSYRAEVASLLEEMITIVGNPVPSTPQPTWTPSPSPTPTPSVVPGTITIKIPTNTPSPTPTPTLGTPPPSSTSTPTPTQGTGTATHTPTPTATPTHITITASPTPTTTPSAEAFFEDVPLEHWAYQSIKDLFDGRFIAGCSLEPLLYCPSNGMDRADASVFITREVEGAEYHPRTPSTPPYADVSQSDWFVEWVNYIKEAGFTSGCGQNQAGQETFCPTRIHTRAEAATFFVRMLEGPDFTPPEPDPQPSFKFDDVADDSSPWYNKWIYYAWDQGIVGDCESPEDLMDNLYRPEEEILREEAACMMAHALGLK